MAFRIVAYDKANNVGYSGWQRVKLGAVQNSDLAIKLTAGKWFRNRTASGAWGGSYALSIGSGGSGAAATLRVPKGVRQVSIVGVVASSLGAGNLYVGSKLIKTVSFKPSSSLTAGFARVVTTLKLSTSTAHTIKLTQKGSKPVTLDAIIELR
jgi:hypothetical protein